MKLVIDKGEEPRRSVNAEITADHPASRDEVPVLLVEGELVPILDAVEAGYRVLEATPDELRALRQAGYPLPAPES
jgi:hypothetical protein